MKYRKKPVIVDADVYKEGMEDGFGCIKGYLFGSGWCSNYDKNASCCRECNGYRPYINTLEGKMYISKGNYIITDIKGERYPCKPDIFHMTHEEVVD